MTHKELLEQLTFRGIPAVLIGGTALRMYHSPRVTHDIDLAVRTLDVDTIIELMYEKNYCLIKSLDSEFLEIAEDVTQAKIWVETEKPASLSFIRNTADIDPKHIALENVDITSQVDFLFELGIPLMKLLKRSKTVVLGNISFQLASIEDLIVLKEQRADRSTTDDEDIRYLNSLLNHPF